MRQNFLPATLWETGDGKPGFGTFAINDLSVSTLIQPRAFFLEGLFPNALRWRSAQTSTPAGAKAAPSGDPGPSAERYRLLLFCLPGTYLAPQSAQNRRGPGTPLTFGA